MKSKSTLQELLDAGFTKLVDLIFELNADQISKGFRASHRTTSLNHTIDSSMEWSRTPQGHGFWQHLYKGKLENAISEYPEWKHLFEPEGKLDLSYQIVTNGLFK